MFCRGLNSSNVLVSKDAMLFIRLKCEMVPASFFRKRLEALIIKEFLHSFYLMNTGT
jgi:hypothetical protein